jgi:hypothetical protein
MKKYGIEKTLQDEDNFDKFYEGLKSNKTEVEIPVGFKNDDELNFYNGDVDFMKFHKRTKQNMQ